MAAEPIIPIKPDTIKKGCQEKNRHPAPVGCVATVNPTTMVNAKNAPMRVLECVCEIEGMAVVSVLSISSGLVSGSCSVSSMKGCSLEFSDEEESKGVASSIR